MYNGLFWNTNLIYAIWVLEIIAGNGLVFSDVRNKMRDNQKALYGVQDSYAQESECGSDQRDIIQRIPGESQLNIRQVKLKHLDRVAATASPVLKTPTRVWYACLY